MEWLPWNYFWPVDFSASGISTSLNSFISEEEILYIAQESFFLAKFHSEL